MFGIGHTELIIILVVVMLFFGAARIPSLAKGLGSGIRIFRKALRDEPDHNDTSQVADKMTESTQRQKSS